ncbi:MAG: hypothetical protein ABIJ09_09035 [Pseudomonadota bacterium]
MTRTSAFAVVLALTACVEVPPEMPAPDNPHKATAVVDSAGRTIRGGNLTLVIPAGAVSEGDRLRVTIDEIRGTPAGNVDDAYLVEPQDYHFNQPISISYRYTTRIRDAASDATKLFLGEARFDSWEPVADQEHDLDARRVTAQLFSFGVFGLVDPLAPVTGLDAGHPAPDASTSPDGSAAQDAGTSPDGSTTPDTGTPADAGPTPDSSVGPDADLPGAAVQIILTWDNGFDLDLHLFHAGTAAFSTTDDCYYATRANLDWAPTGPDNNPILDIDDLDGFGPEITLLPQAISGSYSVGVHLYDRKNLTTTATFTVAVLVDGREVRRITGHADTCDQFFTVLDLQVLSNGAQVITSPRSDAPILPGKSACF